MRARSSRLAVRADRLASAHAGKKLDRILLDLHAPATTVALLPARELDVHVLSDEPQAGGHSLENAHERGSV